MSKLVSVLHSTLPWSGQRCCSPLAAGTERRKPDYEWGWSDESFYRKTGGLLDFCKAVYVSAEQMARLQHRRSPSGTSDISPRSSTTLLSLLERLLPDLMFITGCLSQPLLSFSTQMPQTRLLWRQQQLSGRRFPLSQCLSHKPSTENLIFLQISGCGLHPEKLWWLMTEQIFNISPSWKWNSINVTPLGLRNTRAERLRW